MRAALGVLAGELLGSRQVVPAKLLAAGFAFRHPTLEGALREALG
jgi:NAD dependent epimerase/dehydratase family enzyme